MSSLTSLIQTYHYDFPNRPPPHYFIAEFKLMTGWPTKLVLHKQSNIADKVITT